MGKSFSTPRLTSLCLDSSMPRLWPGMCLDAFWVGRGGGGGGGIVGGKEGVRVNLRGG